MQEYRPYAIINFFLIYSMSMKVPAIVEEVKKALSHDMAVVIGLQTTGEVFCRYIHVYKYVYICIM